MEVAAGPGGRATVDFFAAQDRARHRTRLLVLTFGLAVLVVVAVVYGALSLVAGPSPGLLAASALGTAVVVGVGGAYHAIRLASGGGEAVAALLGGTPVDRGTQDAGLRRLVNVVEEMSIASGVPVPAIYVLEREEGINAFAAGFTPGHSVVAVTRGALDLLTRDELQGVVAHELSHVLHADTRIDLQLMAAVGGLTAVSLVGRVLLDAAPRRVRSRGRDAGGAILAVGIGLLLAGALGAFLGKLVRFAVARQREWLADASAVQFTRNPDGLAGALRKVASQGSALVSPYATEAAHLLFATGATGFFQGLLSTHPPVEERIRRIAPHLLGLRTPAPTAEVIAGARAAMRTVSRAEAAPARPEVAAAPATSAGLAGAVGAAALAGAAYPGTGDRAAARPPPRFHPERADLDRAAEVLESFPLVLVDAARQPAGACALCCALLLDRDPAVRERQLAALEQGTGAMRREVERLAPALGDAPRSSRLALLTLALPALDGLSPDQGRALGAVLRALAQADATTTPFEWAVQRIALRRLARGAGVPPRARAATVDQVAPEALTLLCAVARAGRPDDAGAQEALAAGAGALGGGAWRLLPPDRCAPDGLDAALLRLDEGTAEVKVRVVEACGAVAAADGRVTEDEAELVRAFAAALGVPVPRLALPG